jgi:hypothetical protein
MATLGGSLSQKFHRHGGGNVALYKENEGIG